MKLHDVTFVNVYKPPNVSWPNDVKNVYDHPSVYSGDFNSHAVDWGYDEDDLNHIHLVMPGLSYVNWEPLYLQLQMRGRSIRIRLLVVLFKCPR